MTGFTVGESRGIVGVPMTGHAMLAAAQPMTSYTIRIPDEDGRPLVTIHPNGRVELGEGYEPDEAARAFWDAVQRLSPDSLGRPL
ncbi:hypothetical protein ACIQVK_44780 [Streptomyces sp. NPDC090493]|uniref:hypothetical protein n=1 Tax=Streptomyces sp. NPDC090493 TaxID=3365964 RepID=UPI00382F0ADB